MKLVGTQIDTHLRRSNAYGYLAHLTAFTTHRSAELSIVWLLDGKYAFLKTFNLHYLLLMVE
ncbi:MAG: hypothetical protein LZ173_03670 [Thaumarchaeota archaeon]|nr:hypothetical protein [Candidatus Geocrenenecus arthurdayi]